MVRLSGEFLLFGDGRIMFPVGVYQDWALLKLCLRVLEAKLWIGPFYASSCQAAHWRLLFFNPYFSVFPKLEYKMELISYKVGDKQSRSQIPLLFPF